LRHRDSNSIIIIYTTIYVYECSTLHRYYVCICFQACRRASCHVPSQLPRILCQGKWSRILLQISTLRFKWPNNRANLAGPVSALKQVHADEVLRRIVSLSTTSMLLLRIITVHIKTVHMLAVPVTRRLYDVIINFIFALQEILI